MDYVLEFLKALGLTLLVEVPVLLLLIRKQPLQVGFFAGILATSSTLPYLWFVLPEFISSYTTLLIIGEISIVFIEATIYHFVLRLKPGKALLVSFLCNLASFVLGLLLQHQY